MASARGTKYTFISVKVNIF